MDTTTPVFFRQAAQTARLNGTVIGVPLATLTAKALTSALYGVKRYDGLSYFVAVCGVALVAIVASLVPASRAADIDVLSALRSQ